MNPTPLVTIGLPVFNGENYLEEALDSLRAQDYSNLEIIVSDNASTDGTREIVESAVAVDSRIRYDILPDNIGATRNYNRIVPMANGEFFKWSAHDDVCEPTFISRCVEELLSDPDAVLCYPRTILIDGNGDVIDPEFRDDLFLNDPDPLDRLARYLPHQGEQHAIFGVIKTKALRRTRLIGHHWGGDMVTLADLMLQGHFIEVPDRLFLRRYHESTSMVANRSGREINAWFDPRRRHRHALPRTRLYWSHLRAVIRSDLPLHRRLHGLGLATRIWFATFGRHMAGEMKTAAIELATPWRRS